MQQLPASLDSGVYYGWASVNCGEVHQMVLSIGWNPHFENEKRSMVRPSLVLRASLSQEFLGARHGYGQRRGILEMSCVYVCTDGNEYPHLHRGSSGSTVKCFRMGGRFVELSHRALD